MKKIYLILIFIIFLPFTHANTPLLSPSSLSGYLSDAESGEKLYEGNIYLKNTALGIASNKSGYYHIGNVPPGEYLLTVEFVGYHKYEKQITILPHLKIIQNIELEAKAIALEQLVVEQTNSRSFIDNAINTVRTDPFSLRYMTEFAQPDLVRKIQMQPGITSVSDFSTGLYVRGGNDDHNLILYDDMTVYNPSHLFGVFSCFITDALKSSHLLKSAYGAEYGGRMGSVLDIQSKEGNSKRLEGSVSTSIFATDLVLSGPGPAESGFLLAIRRTHLDPLLSYLDMPSYYFWDMQSQVHYLFSEKDKVILSSYAGGDRLQEDDEDLYYDMDWNNLNFSLRWNHVVTQKIFSFLKISFSNFKIRHSHQNRSADNIFNFYEDLDGENNIRELSLKNKFEYYYNQNLFFAAGLELNNVQMDYNETTAEGELWNLSNNSINTGIFGQAHLTFNENFKIKPGIRLNYLDNLKARYKLQPSPRIQLEFIPDSKNLLTLSYGRYYQSMFTIQHEHIPIKAVNLWFLIDDSVPPGISDNFTLGWERKIWFLKGNYLLSTDIYYKTMDHLLDFSNKKSTFADSTSISDIFTESSAYSYGLEIMLSKQEGKFNGNLSYTFARVKKKLKKENIEYAPHWDLPHSFKSDLNYNFNRFFSMGTNIIYASGRPYEDSYFHIRTYADGSEVYVEEYGSRDGKRYPDYFRWDISANYSWFFPRKQSLLLNLTLTNITNHRNIQEYYNEKIENGRIVRDRFDMLPFVPSLRLSYSF